MLRSERFSQMVFQERDTPKCSKEIFLSTKIVERMGTALPLALGKGETAFIPHFSEHEV